MSVCTLFHPTMANVCSYKPHSNSKGATIMALSFFAAAVLVIIGTLGVVWLVRTRNHSTFSVKTGENSVDGSLEDDGDGDDDGDSDEEGDEEDEGDIGALELGQGLGQGLAQSSLQESLSPSMRRQLHLNLDAPDRRNLHSLADSGTSRGKSSDRLPRSPSAYGSHGDMEPLPGTPLRRLNQALALRGSSSRRDDAGVGADSDRRCALLPCVASLPTHQRPAVVAVPLPRALDLPQLPVALTPLPPLAGFCPQWGRPGLAPCASQLWARGGRGGRSQPLQGRFASVYARQAPRHLPDPAWVILSS
jgi:hypothetical protein